MRGRKLVVGIRVLARLGGGTLVMTLGRLEPSRDSHAFARIPGAGNDGVSAESWTQRRPGQVAPEAVGARGQMFQCDLP